MKNVTDLFKDSCNADIVSSQCKIEVCRTTVSEPVLTLTAEDFIEQTVIVNTKATSSSSFTIGGVCSSKLSLTLTRKGVSRLKANGLLRKNLCWKIFQWNKVADPNQDETDYSINKNGSPNTTGLCSIGVFYVADIGNNDYSCEIVAYDGMLAFDKSVNGSQLSYMQTNRRTLGEWVAYCIENCATGVYDFGYVIDSVLVNKDIGVCISEDSKVETFREAIGYLSTLAGGFATFSDTGDLVIRAYKYEPVTLNTSHKRLLSGRFDSVVSAVTGVYSSVAGFDFESRGSVVGTANKIDIYISENPFLRGIQPFNGSELDQTILSALNSLSSSLITKKFFGCECEVTALPYIELGDCIAVDRLVVSESGEETGVVESNIIVCEQTYNFGSRLKIKSNGATTSSTSAGNVGSQAKVRTDADQRVSELIDALSGVKYEQVVTEIPIVYNRTLTAPPSTMKVFVSESIKQVGGSSGEILEEKVEQIDYSPSFGDNASFGGSIQCSDNNSAETMGLFSFTGDVGDISSYILGGDTDVSNISVKANFSSAGRRVLVWAEYPWTYKNVYLASPNKVSVSEIRLDSDYATGGANGVSMITSKIGVSQEVIKFRFSGSRLQEYKDSGEPTLLTQFSGEESMGRYIPNFVCKTGISDIIIPETGVVDLSYSTLSDLKNAIQSLSFVLGGSFGSEGDSIKGGKLERIVTDYTQNNSVSVKNFSWDTKELDNVYSDIQVHGNIELKLGQGYHPYVAVYYYRMPETVTLSYTLKKEIPPTVDGVAEELKGIDELRNEVARLTQLEILSGAGVDSLNAEMDNVKYVLERHNVSIEGLEIDVTQLDSRLKTLEECCASVNATLVDLNNRVTALEQGGGGSGGSLEITDIWLEDSDGYNYSANQVYSNEVCIPNNEGVYVCVAVSIAGAFIAYKYKAGSSVYALGDTTQSLKSTANRKVSTNSTMIFYAEATYADKTATSKEITARGYAVLTASAKLTSSGSDRTITVTPSGGLPTVSSSGAEYKYKFVYSTSSGVSGETNVLQDWSTSKTLTFTLGSDAINGAVKGYIRFYVTDGFKEYVSYKYFS